MDLLHVQQDLFVLLRLILRNLVESLFRNHNHRPQITKDSTPTSSVFPVLPIRVWSEVRSRVAYDVKHIDSLQKREKLRE